MPTIQTPTWKIPATIISDIDSFPECYKQCGISNDIQLNASLAEVHEMMVGIISDYWENEYV